MFARTEGQTETHNFIAVLHRHALGRRVSPKEGEEENLLYSNHPQLTITLSEKGKGPALMQSFT